MTPPDTIARRRGPVGACSDSELAEHIRGQIEASAFTAKATASYGPSCVLLVFAQARDVFGG
jgi:hypothetical protein